MISKVGPDCLQGKFLCCMDIDEMPGLDIAMALRDEEVHMGTLPLSRA